MTAAPVAGPIAIGISFGAYVADKFINDNNKKTKKGDKK